VPVPTPAVVPVDPPAARVLDRSGEVVAVSGRGHLSAPPVRLETGAGPPVDVVAWAGPWPVDERWWDPQGHRRRARLQLELADGRAVLVHVERGAWAVEGAYD
jgi:protein ImuB